jgi:hypothetical protein
MDRDELIQWNRGLVAEVIDLLEQNQQNVADVISRLRGFLAVNPGGPTVPEMKSLSTDAEQV